MLFATILAVIFAAILGALICFLGYRVFLVMLPIWGFFAGFWLGAAGVTLFLGEGFLATVTGWVVGFVIGLVGALLSYMFYGIAVALLAAVLGMSLASGIMIAIGFSPGLIVTIVSVFNGIVVAVLSLVFNLQKYVIIVLSAISGAVLIVFGGMLLFGQITLADLQAGGSALQPIFQGSWFWGLVWLVLTVAGVVVQIRANQTYEFQKEMYVEGWG